VSPVRISKNVWRNNVAKFHCWFEKKRNIVKTIFSEQCHHFLKYHQSQCSCCITLSNDLVVWRTHLTTHV
jgi:hypothetical protein